MPRIITDSFSYRVSFELKIVNFLARRVFFLLTWPGLWPGLRPGLACGLCFRPAGNTAFLTQLRKSLVESATEYSPNCFNFASRERMLSLCDCLLNYILLGQVLSCQILSRPIRSATIMPELSTAPVICFRLKYDERLQAFITFLTRFSLNLRKMKVLSMLVWTSLKMCFGEVRTTSLLKDWEKFLSILVMWHDPYSIFTLRYLFNA